MTGLLGEEEEEGAGILASNYLARGHLTPDADFGAKSKLFPYGRGFVFLLLRRINCSEIKKERATLRLI